jgi:hypothetical protein
VAFLTLPAANIQKIVVTFPTLGPQSDTMSANTSLTAVFTNPDLLASESVLATFHSPLEAATHYITVKYNSLGGAGGILGPTDGNISPCPDGVGFFQHYWNNGSIYWTPSTGAWAVLGSIREKWAALGWERSFLGYPVADQSVGLNPQTSGAYQNFQGGAIYTYTQPLILTTQVTGVATSVVANAAPAAQPAATTHATTAVTATHANLNLAATHLETNVATTAATHAVLVRPPKPSIATTHEVHGAILAKYQELGAEGSFLGYPTTDETGTPDGVGRFNHFQAGSIYWTPSTGAHEVHGLIRDFWAAHGWERNAALGYPISDELIPDRRIGHVRPEAQRKPIAAVPTDVVKLPVEAAAAGVPRTAINVVTSPKTIAPTLTVNPNLGVLGGLVNPQQPASTPAPDRSVNRFSDFENGVVFWTRGAAAAEALSPWTKSADGTVIQKKAADIVAATLAQVGSAVQFPGGAVVPVFAGATAYSWDGAGTQGRRHQIQITVTVPVPVPQVHTVMLYVLVMFEPERRKITACLADYATGEAAVAAKLDLLLWSPFDILTFPDTNNGAAYSILSVKTMTNGDVNTYIEPNTSLAVNINRATLETSVVGRIG